MNPVQLLASTSYAARAEEPATPLKPLLREAGMSDLRRSNRFTALALLGALRCCAGRELPSQCGLYLSSASGGINDTATLLQELIRDRLAPMPLHFINVSSNIAGFSVARELGLHGRNLAVSRLDGGFDCAMELALMDLQAGSVPMALVGVVEECAQPLSSHRRRLGVEATTPLAEQSSWLLLGRGEDEGVQVNWRRHSQALTGEPAEPQAWLAAGDARTCEPGYSPSLSVHQLLRRLETQDRCPLHYLSADQRLQFDFLPAPTQGRDQR
ncbi:MAG: beta-ketoacyl synthase N-terminal-like domain-containing protein [Pseudomonadota bacterium]